ITPIQLSALVLKELKGFLPYGESVESIVITIPASFDTVQSNATKKAGYEAGFKEVLLLQEPIAAALAYFNDSKQEIPEKGNWLVYDLGGGTFDVALVSIRNGELRVADHEGNNFLGGMDFDAQLIEHLILPELIRHTGNPDIETELRNRQGSLEKLYAVLLHKAEEAKKELSRQATTEIEFAMPGETDELQIPITREAFHQLIHEKIQATVQLISAIMRRNQLQPEEINCMIMVGGSTYIPYVRELVAKETGIRLAFDSDPTTAIAVGAAYYAGSKMSTATTLQPDTEKEAKALSGDLTIRAVFQTVSSEEEELYMAVPESGDFTGVYYRITRADGGYDSGSRKVEKRISEFLPLQKASLNQFTIRFFDEHNNSLAIDHPPIHIMQGKFNVAGQPLPNDICLEIDDPEHNRTKLQVIFERNDILPLKKTVYKEISRPLKKGSDDLIVINVLEGTRHSRPHSNLMIGVIEIKGTDLATDLAKGSDIEIRLELSESRDLTITVYLAMSEQEFRHVFSPSEKQVSIARLKDEIHTLLYEMRRELDDQKNNEEESGWELELRECILETEKLRSRVQKLRETDLTDEKYEISEARRRLSSRYDALGNDQRLISLQAEYFNHKNFIEESLPYLEFDRDKVMEDFDRTIKDENQFLRAKSTAILRAKIDALDLLRRRVYANARHHIIDFFLYYASVPPSSYPKPQIAATLIRQGEEALEKEQFAQVRTIMINLSHQLHGETEFEKIKIKGTGIG
ncbi:MAG TPA: Hsp70 family protein, partial [Flavisolibacter sp.]|nr:Hsp70 family protein [Flavisolibacter sp.]